MRRLGRLLLGAALLGAGLVPVRAWERLPDLCLFHRVTGLPCPTCGMTRSWAALAHGDLVAAFRFHALGPPLLLGLCLWALVSLRRPEGLPLKGIWAWGLGAVWVFHALIRMVAHLWIRG